jgi:hypothetical protein
VGKQRDWLAHLDIRNPAPRGRTRPTISRARQDNKSDCETNHISRTANYTKSIDSFPSSLSPHVQCRRRPSPRSQTAYQTEPHLHPPRRTTRRRTRVWSHSTTSGMAGFEARNMTTDTRRACCQRRQTQARCQCQCRCRWRWLSPMLHGCRRVSRVEVGDVHMYPICKQGHGAGCVRDVLKRHRVRSPINWLVR